MGFKLFRTEEDIKELWSSYSAEIYRICCLYLGDTYSADYALTQVFINIMKHEESFASKAACRSWLILEAQNVCSDSIRSWWHNSLGKLTDSDRFVYDEGDYLENEELKDTKPSEYPFAGETIEVSEFLSKLIRLPAKYKLPMYLLCADDLASDSISKLTAIRRELVRSRLHNAKKLLEADIFTEEFKAAFKQTLNDIKLSGDKSDYLLKLTINKAKDEEFYSNITPAENEEDEFNVDLIQPDFDDRAESIALLKANFPKLIPGFISIIVIIVIMIWYFTNNS